MRQDGTVKVLDFGLAKALDQTATANPLDALTSPTITTPAMTAVGVLLGTAAYMSPEQARGKPVGSTSWISVFGCVLYEMVTGRRAFDGEDVSLTLSQILQREPAFEALPADVPARVRQTLRSCLRKSQRTPARHRHRAGRDWMGRSRRRSIRQRPASRRRDDSSTGRRVVADRHCWWRHRRHRRWELMPGRGSGPHKVVRFAMPSSADVAPSGAPASAVTYLRFLPKYASRVLGCTNTQHMCATG